MRTNAMTIILVTFFVFTSLLPNSHGYGATFPDGKRQLELKREQLARICHLARSRGCEQFKRQPVAIHDDNEEHEPYSNAT
ncbi:hypothetical protein P5673_013218 [Acropora cervicornis]|uniref:Uncharacterized protein n=1 Tax=Acropora cervicornis TaxID=6130 RepID=A0AAD9QLH5_ACRCE|nr:hypothetical protein P5673_013218 [Acropora cervicornis]